MRSKGQRMIYGAVTAAGAVAQTGSGDWSVTKGSTGINTVRFTPPFRGPIGLTVSCNAGAIAAVGPNSPEQTLIYTYSAAGAPENQPFNFVATGRA